MSNQKVPDAAPTQNHGISWDDAQTFLAVSETMSFSAAARHLGVGQPTISRRIAELETRLGVQLFLRGRQGAELTLDAERLLPAAQQMARWAAEFVRNTETNEQTISGVVRIAAPPGIAVEQLAPFARQARDKYPQLTLELLSSVEHVDLTRGAADLAVRTQAPNEPELVTLRQVTTGVGVYASASYAATIQQPCTWHDLDWITWNTAFRHVQPRPMLERLIEDFQPAFSSDDYLVQKSALYEGLGAMITSKLHQPTERDNALVELDLGVELPSSEFYLVCAKSIQHVPRVRAVAAMLIDAIEQQFN